MVSASYRVLFVLMLNIFVVSNFAANLTLKSDQTLIPMGGTVEVQFVFEGLSNSPNLGAIDIAGFQIVGRSNSSSIQFINGQKSETATITLQLRPKVTGRLTIGPYELSYNNQKLRSNQLVIVVDSSALQKSDKTDIFIEAEIKKDKLVSGEQTLYILKVYRPVHKTNYSRISFSLPETNDVILEEKKSSQKDYQKKVNDELYQVTEVSIPMYALKSGQWQIPAASVNYFVKDKSTRNRRRSFFDSFFDDDLFGGRGKKKQSWTKNLTIEVQEITKAKPKTFSGLIGAFTIEQTLSKTELSTDDNLTLKLKVTGIGNLNDLLEIPVEIPGFKIYPDGEGDLTEKKDQEGYLGGIKEFSYALVPNEVGDKLVGPFELSYFNPKQNEFVQVKTNQQLVKISQGKAKIPSELVIPDGNQNTMEDSQSKKKKVKVLKHNILPLEMDYDLTSGFLLSRSHIVLFSIVLIFLTVFFDLFFKDKFTLKKSKIDQAYSNAWSLYQKDVAKKESPSKSFTNFILRKLKFEVLEKTPEELLEMLKEKKLEKELFTEIKNLFDQEEMNKYSGAAQKSSSTSDWTRLAESLNRLL